MTNDSGVPQEPDSRDDIRSDAAENGVQDEPIMDGNDASPSAKWEGIVAQTRADLGRHPVDDIRRALSQRISDSQLAVPAGEVDRVAQELATGTGGSDRLDRGTAHEGE
ncbi:MAG: hypothetical protein ACRDT9_08910 [Agromyces sp.]